MWPQATQPGLKTNGISHAQWPSHAGLSPHPGPHVRAIPVPDLERGYVEEGKDMTGVKLDKTLAERIAWIWHDAEIVAVNIDYTIAWETTLTIRCMLHLDEPRDELFTLGITSAIVELRFQGIDTAQLQLHYKTGNQETIDSWVISDEQGELHYFTTQTGSRFAINAAALWLIDVWPDRV